MNKISVIIPIYNTAQYLSRCLQSVCNQTYTNLEIVCVNDGSTDASGEIANDFAQKDARFQVIHQSNAGESNARNVGLAASTGQYITFVDCDDWIEPKMYEVLLRSINNTNVDMVASGYYLDCMTGSVKVKNELPVSEGIIERSELFRYVYQRDSYRGVSSYIWCKLFHKELLYHKGELIRFDEELTLGGDVLFFLQVASYVQSAVYVSDAFYHYYQREDSAIHDQRNLKAWKDILQAYIKGIEHLTINHVEEDSIPWLKRFLGYRASLVAQYSLKQKNKEMLLYSQNIMNQVIEEYIALNVDNPERIILYKTILLYSIG